MNRGLARRRNPRRLDTHSFLTTAAFARPTPGPPVPCKTWRGTQSGAGDTQRGKRGREILSPQPKSPGFFPVSIWAADIGATGRFRLERKAPQLQKRTHTQGNHKTGEECRMQEVYGPRSGLEKERGRGGGSVRYDRVWGGTFLSSTSSICLSKPETRERLNWRSSLNYGTTSLETLSDEASGEETYFPPSSVRVSVRRRLSFKVNDEIVWKLVSVDHLNVERIERRGVKIYKWHLVPRINTFEHFCKKEGYFSFSCLNLWKKVWSILCS